MKDYIRNQVLTEISVMKELNIKTSLFFHSGVAIGMIFAARESKSLDREECDEWLRKIYRARNERENELEK